MLFFCPLQVFGNAPPSSMMEKFSDLLQFTTQVSRLMVTEIRRRASNKSTGELADAHRLIFVSAKMHCGVGLLVEFFGTSQ